MTTLARASRYQQLKLLDLPPTIKIESNAQARNVYGSLAQEVACAALGLRPIPIDGRCLVCFDAERDGRFIEIKSVHASGKLVVYDWRMEKEAAFSNLDYVIVVHKARGCQSVSALLASFEKFLEIWWMPAPIVHKAALQCPLRLLIKPSSDPRNGYSRAGYVRGYRNVPPSMVRSGSEPRALSFTLFNMPFKATVRFR